MLGINDIDETGKTFEENAIIKVKNVPNGSIGLSDDSGLCIKSLNHEPGIYSARYAQKNGCWSKAMEKLYFEAKKKKMSCCYISLHFSIKIRELRD